jgi:hypothetical protein
MSESDPLKIFLPELMPKTGDKVVRHDQDSIPTGASVVTSVSPVERIKGSAVVIEAQTITVATAIEMPGSGEPLLKRVADDSWLPKPLDTDKMD